MRRRWMEGRLCWSQKVPNDQAAIEELVARAGDCRRGALGGGFDRLAAALLLAVLAAAGQQVGYVPAAW